MSNLCEMVNPHHPDCECSLCYEMRDEECPNPAVAVVDGHTNVCEKCAREMESEGFDVVFALDNHEFVELGGEA